MSNQYMQLLITFVVSFAVAFALTPFVRWLAPKIRAVDVPKDNRRMHKKPIPLCGGLAIFFGFTVGVCVFYTIFCGGLTREIIAFLGGALLIVIVGVIDDIIDLKPLLKLVGQIIAACIVASQGVLISGINISGIIVDFGPWAYLITVFWIVAMTNAINLIDGLDGLACGISAISGISILLIAILASDFPVALVTASLVAGCFGFLPFNSNPASIFMGDTGAMFLGYSLAIVSIMGVVKTSMIVSLIIPLIIFGLPIFDTSFAFARRILQGRSPFSADRGHLHHRLIDAGFNQRQSVMILYTVCSVLGLLGILLAENKILIFLILLGCSIAIGIYNLILLRRHIRARDAELAKAEKAAAGTAPADNEILLKTAAPSEDGSSPADGEQQKEQE